MFGGANSMTLIYGMTPNTAENNTLIAVSRAASRATSEAAQYGGSKR
jgi:hypothetical protein